MEQMIRLLHPWLVFIAVLIISIIAVMRYFLYKPIQLRYSLVSALVGADSINISMAHKRVPFLLRFLMLLLLAVVLGRPQQVNVHSKVHVEGIDIMLVLDASGSMQCFDDVADPKPRFDIAKQEAMRFIQKRPDDPIGLVLFGQYAVSRCPLTLDKNIIHDIIEPLKLGMINPDGTVLCTAICMAAKRLKNSKSKSKIMIVLTDGEPTAELDIEPRKAIELVKKLGIKVYTIGIGGEHGGLVQDPFFGIRPMGFKLNKKLLEAIAHHTGGKFFLAKNATDMKNIYDTIDTLEKTEYEVPLFTQYKELIDYFGILILVLLVAEIIATSLIWFCL